MDGSDSIFVYPQDAEHDTGTGFKAFKRGGGMELRDYFAGRAMALFSHSRADTMQEAAEKVATACYLIADAFLVEREKGRG